MDFNIQDKDDKEQLIKHVNLLMLSGVKMVSVKEIKKKRSLNANALYWKWLSIICNYTGDDVQGLHHDLKVKFLGFEENKSIISKTEKLQNLKVKSSKKLSTNEFYNYMVQVEIFAKRFLEITLPTPDH